MRVDVDVRRPGPSGASITARGFPGVAMRPTAAFAGPAARTNPDATIKAIHFKERDFR
jgi:hypothetical protein